MAVILKLRCPDCAETFKWPGAQKWPEFCPLCRAQLSTHSDEICMPFISSARAKSPDRVYRQMEAGAEVRAQAAAEILGVSTSDVSDLKMTNLKDNHSEIAHVSVVNDVSRMMDTTPNATGFQAAGVAYSGAVQTGAFANSGAKTQNMLRNFHGKTFGHSLMSERPGLETEQPGYRRRA